MEQQLFTDTLDFLKTLAINRIKPAGTTNRLNALREKYPDTQIELVWEKQAFDNVFHYDALISRGEDDTVSLSYCPDKALPWPMRGVKQWSDGELLRVNDTTLRVEEAMEFLDFIWNEERILSRLVEVCLIREVIECDNIEASNHEIQQAIDAFRKSRNLFEVEDMHRWMEQHGIDLSRLEDHMADSIVKDKIRDKLTSGQISAYFDTHQSDFDSVCFEYLDFETEQEADEGYGPIVMGKVTFYEIARKRLKGTIECANDLTEGLFSYLRKQEIQEEELAAALFTAEVDDIIGPVQWDDKFRIIRILSRRCARLDDATVSLIKDLLFEEWLETKRGSARIEWYWGRNDVT